MPKDNDTLYKEVVYVTHEYFGLAADRFVTRQIELHLRKTPTQLRKQDLAGLIDWMSLAMSLIVDDQKLVRNYASDLRRLTNGNGAARHAQGTRS